MAWRSAPGCLPMLLAGSVMVWPCHSVVRVLPSGGELAANAVGIGNEEDGAEPVAEVAVGVVVLIEHFFGSARSGEASTSTFPRPGKLAVIWSNSMPRPGRTVMLVNSGWVLLVTGCA